MRLYFLLQNLGKKYQSAFFYSLFSFSSIIISFPTISLIGIQQAKAAESMPPDDLPLKDKAQERIYKARKTINILEQDSSVLEDKIDLFDGLLDTLRPSQKTQDAYFEVVDFLKLVNNLDRDISQKQPIQTYTDKANKKWKRIQLALKKYNKYLLKLDLYHTGTIDSLKMAKRDLIEAENYLAAGAYQKAYTVASAALAQAKNGLKSVRNAWKLCKKLEQTRDNADDMNKTFKRIVHIAYESAEPFFNNIVLPIVYNNAEKFIDSSHELQYFAKGVVRDVLETLSSVQDMEKEYQNVIHFLNTYSELSDEEQENLKRKKDIADKVVILWKDIQSEIEKTEQLLHDLYSNYYNTMQDLITEAFDSLKKSQRHMAQLNLVAAANSILNAEEAIREGQQLLEKIESFIADLDTDAILERANVKVRIFMKAIERYNAIGENICERICNEEQRLCPAVCGPLTFAL